MGGRQLQIGTMEYEKLALEVSAMKAGLKPVEPRSVQGASGVEHVFTLLFSDGERKFGFDFCESVEVIDVIRSYAKKLDSGIPVNIVCVTGRVTEEANKLALLYDIHILGPQTTDTFFLFEPVPPRRTFG